MNSKIQTIRQQQKKTKEKTIRTFLWGVSRLQNFGEIKVRFFFIGFLSSLFFFVWFVVFFFFFESWQKNEPKKKPTTSPGRGVLLIYKSNS
jgi:hypothetical protein